MKKYLLLLILVLTKLKGYSQTEEKFFQREWKRYYNDSISFKYLKLTKNGTNLIAFGQTLNGKDTIYQYDHNVINDWHINDDTLTLLTNFRDGQMIRKYLIRNKKRNSFEASGLNSKVPNFLKDSAWYSQNEFKFIDSKTLKGCYGTNNAKCLSELSLFTYEALDSLNNNFDYKGVGNIIPHIMNCGTGSMYVSSFEDSPYRLKVPKTLDNYSFEFDDNEFEIILSSSSDTIETCIVIYFDFIGYSKKDFLKRFKPGRLKAEKIIENNKEIYLFKNLSNEYSGEVFYDKHIHIGYYTRNAKLESQLRDCISSFKYK